MDTIGPMLLFLFLASGCFLSTRWVWRKLSKSGKTVEYDLGELRADGLNLTWVIEYEDAKGCETERRITVREVYCPAHANYPKYLRAYCHLRKEDRTFNVFNIVSAHDAETGEVVPLRSASRFWKWLEGRYGGLPAPPPKPTRKRKATVN